MQEEKPFGSPIRIVPGRFYRLGKWYFLLSLSVPIAYLVTRVDILFLRPPDSLSERPTDILSFAVLAWTVPISILEGLIFPGSDRIFGTVSGIWISVAIWSIYFYCAGALTEKLWNRLTVGQPITWDSLDVWAILFGLALIWAFLSM